MANYSIWVLGESNISLTGGVGLDGITQGDGSHLVGESLTINNWNADEVQVRDRGPERFFADNDSTQELRGRQTIDGVRYDNKTVIEAEYSFVVRDNATGIEYTLIAINIVTTSPTYGTVEALAFLDQAPPAGVPLEVISAQEGPPNDGPNAIGPDDLVPICLARGTLVDTAEGPRPVEDLAAGDAVRVLSGGHAVLRVICRRSFGPQALAQNPRLCPVRITAGSLGAGLPRRDLLVSRQHRMLVSSRVAERMFGTRDALVPAIRLIGLPGIGIATGTERVEYFHLLFDRHQVIFAEGAPTESLFTGPEALKAVSPEARAEILTIFPELARAEYIPAPACMIPSRPQQKSLVARHIKNNKPLLAEFEAGSAALAGGGQGHRAAPVTLGA